MAITSLVIKIGARDEEIQAALASIGLKSKSLDADLAKLGNTPVGQAAQKSLEQMQASMKAVTDAQKALGERAYLAATGIAQMGGVTKLTSDELNALSRTVTKGIDAFRALGHDAPAQLTAVSVAIKAQQDALAGVVKGWEGFVKGFNIEDAIANPLATARKAAFAFAESIGGVALAAAATIAGLAAVGAAIYKLAANAAAVGGNLDDMADKTGMSVPALSKLQNAAAVAGTDLGKLTDAVFKVEQRMGEGGAEWDKALAKMGLSTEQLRAAGPDRLLQTITEGLATIQDPADRAATGVALMGKGFKDVVPVLLDLNAAFALTNDITPWTAEQAKDAEHFEMQMASLVVHAEALGTAIGRDLMPFVSKFVSVVSTVAGVLAPLIGQFSGITSKLHLLGDAWSYGAAAIDVFRKAASKLPTVTGDAKAGVDKAAKALKALAVTVYDPGDPTSVAKAFIIAEAAEKQLDARNKELTTSNNTLAAAAKKAAEEHLKFTDSVRNLTSSAVGAVKGFGAYGVLMADLSVQNVAAQESFYNLSASVNEFHDGLTVAGDTIATVTIPLFASLPNVVAQATDQIKAAGQATHTFRDTINDSLRGIPDVFIRAFTGGGGVAGALKAIAVDLARDFSKTLADGIKVTIAAGGSGFTAMTAKAAAATGAMAGLGVAMSGAGGKAAAASAAMAGVTVAAGALGAGATIGGAVALGAATAGIGLAAVGAYFAIKQMLKDPEKKVNPVREEFVKLHGGLDALDKAAHVAGVSLTAMLNARTPEAYAAAIADLNRALDSQAADVADLDAAIQKYGFSIEQLGPAMQRQMLDAQAKELLNDWRLLVGSGIDLTVVNEKMAGTMNDFLAVARTTGVEVPAAMKPILQTMIDQGLLTDAAGNKITDLADVGVTFSETMTQGFDRVVAKLTELLDKIGLVPKALNQIPTNTDVDINLNGRWNIPDMPRTEGFALGGVVHAFASGGRVLPFVPRGTDTVPAMLTPGERVLTVQETQAYEATGTGGGGNAALVAATNALRGDIARMVATMQQTQARVTRDEVQKVVRR